MMRSILVFCTLFFLSNSAHGAITVAGSVLPFDGPGLYTFDFVATAVNQAETIQGFTMPLSNRGGATPVAESPDISLSDIAFDPNPLLELRLSSSDFISGGFGFSIAAEDSDGSPLVLAEGESAVLFSIPMQVLSPGVVLAENVDLATLRTITTPTGPAEIVGFTPAGSVAIPEPGGVSLLAFSAVIAIGYGIRRRRDAML